MIIIINLNAPTHLSSFPQPISSACEASSSFPQSLPSSRQSLPSADEVQEAYPVWLSLHGTSGVLVGGLRGWEGPPFLLQLFKVSFELEMLLNKWNRGNRNTIWTEIKQDEMKRGGTTCDQTR